MGRKRARFITKEEIASWRIDFPVAEARQLLNLPYLQDRVICFIPEWEVSKLEFSRNFNEQYGYRAQELTILSQARKELLQNNKFSFLAYRKIKSKPDKISPYYLKIYKIGFRHHAKTEAQKKLVGMTLDLDNFIQEKIEITSNKTKEEKLLLNEDVLDCKKIGVLCIDYNVLVYGILSSFINYEDDRTDRILGEFPKDIDPLYRIFSSAVATSVSVAIIKDISNILIEASKGELGIETHDRIEFLSSNHNQRIPDPAFWDILEQNDLGYLCEYNLPKDQIKNISHSATKNDYRVFYSFESLIYWELKHCLQKRGRCQNCNELLPILRTVSKIYCDKLACKQDRNRKKQRKHYKKNSKHNQDLTRK